VPALHAPVLIGDTDLARLEAAVRHPGVVTLTGPAGVGKTSLARVLAAKCERGALWVELAPLTQGEQRRAPRGAIAAMTAQQVLVTSQQPLRVQGERVQRVGPDTRTQSRWSKKKARRTLDEATYAECAAAGRYLDDAAAGPRGHGAH
jgi:ABC-type Mn2+/Zn2+ transport system ATPase subunit